jgi:hypothetical protein
LFFKNLFFLSLINLILPKSIIILDWHEKIKTNVKDFFP